MIAGFVRGLSVRDVEATLADALGAEAALSKSTVSRVCEAIKHEFEHWKVRDLSSVALEYLCLDGSHFRMHERPCRTGARRPGYHHRGTPGAGRPRHRGQRVHRRLEGLLGRDGGKGPASPAVGRLRRAPGLIAAVEVVFPNSLRQRSAIHRKCKESRWCLRSAPGRHGVEEGGEGLLIADVAADAARWREFVRRR
jgi:putative transposase